MCALIFGSSVWQAGNAAGQEERLLLGTESDAGMADAQDQQPSTSHTDWASWRVSTGAKVRTASQSAALAPCVP